jgi:hypothetical protein
MKPRNQISSSSNKSQKIALNTQNNLSSRKSNYLENLLSQKNIWDITPHRVRKLVKAYYDLSMRPSLSDKEGVQLEKIYSQASQIHLLDFWVTEIDHILGHRLGLLSEDNRVIFAKQQDLLSQKINQENPCENFSERISKCEK